MLNGYIAALPVYAEYFRENYFRLISDINEVHARVTKVLQPFIGQTFYVFHPAFGHFAKAYGLKQKAVEFEGKIPTPRWLSALISQAKEENIKIIFVQPQFDKSSALTIAMAINGVVLEMDPLAANILLNFHDMAEKIEKSFTADHS